MKKLVVFYSRSGTTERVAKEISQELKCDIEEIHDRKKRGGWLGWIIAGKDGSQKRTTIIEKTKYNPSSYDLVIIGTPIWVNTTPAIRTYVTANANNLRKVAFFCTMGGTGGKSAFEEMEKIIGKKPIALLELREKDVKSGNYKDTLREFISKIK